MLDVAASKPASFPFMISQDGNQTGPESDSDEEWPSVQGIITFTTIVALLIFGSLFALGSNQPGEDSANTSTRAPNRVAWEGVRNDWSRDVYYDVYVVSQSDGEWQPLQKGRKVAAEGWGAGTSAALAQRCSDYSYLVVEYSTTSSRDEEGFFQEENVRGRGYFDLKCNGSYGEFIFDGGQVTATAEKNL